MGIRPRTYDGWKYRRLVVFSITLLALVLPFVPYVSPEAYWPVYTVVGTVLSAYIGFATVDQRWDKDREANTLIQARHFVDNPDVGR